MSTLNLDDFNHLIDSAAIAFSKAHNVCTAVRTHLKTGKHYFTIGDRIIQCTNGHEDEMYVLYSDGIRLYVREASEFDQKFG